MNLIEKCSKPTAEWCRETVRLWVEKHPECLPDQNLVPASEAYANRLKHRLAWRKQRHSTHVCKDCFHWNPVISSCINTKLSEISEINHDPESCCPAFKKKGM